MAWYRVHSNASTCQLSAVQCWIAVLQFAFCMILELLYARLDRTHHTCHFNAVLLSIIMIIPTKYKHDSGQWCSTEQFNELAPRCCNIAWHSHRTKTLCRLHAQVVLIWENASQHIDGYVPGLRTTCSCSPQSNSTLCYKGKYTIKLEWSCNLSISLAKPESTIVNMNGLVHKACIVKLQLLYLEGDVEHMQFASHCAAQQPEITNVGLSAYTWL